MHTHDDVMPTTAWQFNDDVTRAFDDMLQRSIPQYEVMRQACFDLGASFVAAQHESTVVDLGCSRGEALAPFVEKFGAYNRYIGYDISEPMLAAARDRFRTFPDPLVQIKSYDLRHGYPPVHASLTLCILTLQFTPIEYRQRIVRDMYIHTTSGGAVILVEKILGATADLDRLCTTNYYALKAQHGYSQEQIERKRLSLEGVLVPITARWNEELLTSAGFRQVECFWRWMNFAGWIAIKD